MNKKIFLILLLSMFLMSFTSTASIGIVTQNQEMQITNFCSTADCTYANITNIKYPNGTVSNMNEEMTKENNNFYYDYTPNDLGIYDFITCSNPDGIELCEKDSFESTPNGKDFTTGNSIIYIGFIIILLFTFFLTIYGAGKIKWKNKRNNEGKVLTINNFRYLKILLYVMSYFELMFLFGLSYKICRETDIEGFTQFFNFIYQIFSNLMYPLIVLLVIIMIITWLQNIKLNKRIKLGLER